jgi:chromosome segregation protein
MRIKSLNINGFKSFCDETRINFDNSLTAVVGPNGCGKSNIVDAIRWALGEQSARNLRGRGMEDVIFNGSKNRGAQSLAEVTITFHNDDGLSHQAYSDYPEIAVTRRLHRDGTSEYLINKTPCRLKDVFDLFMGTGGGARAYSIIEQGRIGLIVSSRSEDRRAMIEEAAGITRYKAARRLAGRKMDQTRQHLLRVTDVVAEMERNLSHLKRQARKAERVKRHQAEQLDQELWVASHRFLELCARTATLDQSLAAAEEGLEAGRGELRAAEARMAACRVAEQESRTVLDRDKVAAHEIDTAILRLESDLGHLRENLERLRGEERTSAGLEAESASRLRTLEEEREALVTRTAEIERDALRLAEQRTEADRLAGEARERLTELGTAYDARRDRMSRARARIAASDSVLESLEQRIGEARERLETVTRERSEIDRRIAESELQAAVLAERAFAVESALGTAAGTVEVETGAYERLRTDLDACERERQQVRDELQSKSSRLESLVEMHEGLERHDRAVREAVAALREAGNVGFEGLLVDFVSCPETHELALAAALADRLQALVTRDRQAGLELLSWLRERDLGRVTVLPIRGLAPRETKAEVIDDPDVLGRLTDSLTVREDLAGALGGLIGDVLVVRDLAAAERLWPAYPGRVSLVTLDGQYLGSRGVLRGGRPSSAGADLLVQNREIRVLGEQVRGLEAAHADLDARFGGLKDDLLRRREAAEHARLEVRQQEIVLAETRKDKSRAADELDAMRGRRESIEREVANQRGLVEQTVADRDRVAAEAAEARREVGDLEQGLAEDQARIDACREEADRLSAAAADQRVREARIDQQRGAAIDRSQQIAVALAEFDEQTSRAARRRLETARDQGRAAGRIVYLAEELAGRLAEADRLRELVAARTRELEAVLADLAEAEAGVDGFRVQAGTGAERVADLRMQRQEAGLDVTHLIENVGERYGINLLRVVGDHHMRPIPGPEVRARIDELKALIERMGPVNPGAIEEYGETRKRHEEKVRHKEDVEQALEDLERAISRMDKDSRRLFKETFEVVDARFRETFPRLFKGGQARLELTDPDDLLTTGVDIIAQPPGKRVGNIELLSGGEKALTAVALLFAIFLHRPSPFCLLDEVDAPLDEANVGRFVQMVRELTDRSQFILITHGKATMEGCDALYGVTMEEPGVSKMVSVRLVREDSAAAPTPVADSAAATA